MAEYFLFAVPLLLVFPLWLIVVSLLARSFGVQMPLGVIGVVKRRRAPQPLTFSQYLVICGVLCFGCGMFIVTTLSDYLEWKYARGSPFRLTPGRFFGPIIGGIVFGLITWNGRSGESR